MKIPVSAKKEKVGGIFVSEKQFGFFLNMKRRDQVTPKSLAPKSWTLKELFWSFFAWRLYVCQSVCLYIFNIFNSAKNTESILNQHLHKLSLGEENSSSSLFIKGQTLFQGNKIDDYFQIAGISKQIYFWKTIDTFVKVLWKYCAV